MLQVLSRYKLLLIPVSLLMLLFIGREFLVLNQIYSNVNSFSESDHVSEQFFMPFGEFTITHYRPIQTEQFGWSIPLDDSKKSEIFFVVPYGIQASNIVEATLKIYFKVRW